MSTGAVVVGIGQDVAGDDGVGLVVARTLAARGLDARPSADASLVLSLLGEGRRVVVVDAVVGGGPVGAVFELAPGALAAGPRPLSSHGVGVLEAVEIARALYGEDVVERLAIVGVVIERPSGLTLGLSPPVAASVETAATRVAALVAVPGRA